MDGAIFSTDALARFFLPSHFPVNGRADICGGLHFHIIELRPFPLQGRIWLS